MLRAGQLLPPEGLSTLGFDAGRFPPTPPACYRAAWPLPGPDFHRLASTSLHIGHLKSNHLPPLIRAHAAGHNKLGSGAQGRRAERRPFSSAPADHDLDLLHPEVVDATDRALAGQAPACRAETPRRAPLLGDHDVVGADMDVGGAGRTGCLPGDGWE